MAIYVGTAERRLWRDSRAFSALWAMSPRCRKQPSARRIHSPFLHSRYGICFRQVALIKKQGGNMAIRRLPTALLHLAVLTLLLVAGAARTQQPAQPKVADPTAVTIDEKS